MSDAEQMNAATQELQDRLWEWMNCQDDLVCYVKDDPKSIALEVSARWHFGEKITRSSGLRIEQDTDEVVVDGRED